MDLPLIFLDAVAIEEVPIAFWRQAFDVLGWPTSLRDKANTFTHNDVQVAIPNDDLSELRFGRETRTPAMQAGLVSTRLNWSDVFTAPGHSLRILVAVVRIPVTVQLIETGTTELTTFSWPHEQRTAA